MFNVITSQKCPLGNPQNGRKIFPNYTSGKGLIFRTHRELLIFKTKIKQPNSKMSKEFMKTFLQSGMQMANKHIERSTSLDIKEIKIKSTMRCHFIFVRHYQHNRK